MNLNNILKWIATTLLIIGSGVNGFEHYHPIGPLILLSGGIIWLIVSIRWREPALIATNAAMSITGATTLILNHHGIDVSTLLTLLGQ